MSALKNTIQGAFGLLGLEIASRQHLQLQAAKIEQLAARLQSIGRADEDLQLLRELHGKHAGQLIRMLPKSKSQLRQDIFVLSQLELKRGGFFVDFGASNGIDLSNSYLLESEFGWRGILAEPARCWHSILRANRDGPIETDCVWRSTGEFLLFTEVTKPELSSLVQYGSADFHHYDRRQGSTYQVKTISLLDLLDKYQAPKDIDYLSIDTEGSEYEILSAFDFGKYSFRVITCEHNFTPARERIFELLTTKGYERKLQPLSKFEDWYVKR